MAENPFSIHNKSRNQAHLNTTSPASNQAPWTAARCNRLLRPISSKIMLLRKAKRSGVREMDLGKDDQSAWHTREGRSREVPVCKMRPKSSEGLDNADDEAWDPNPRPTKKIKRTYSSKRGANTHEKVVEMSHAGRLLCSGGASTEISVPDICIPARNSLNSGIGCFGSAQTTASQDNERLFAEKKNPASCRPRAAYPPTSMSQSSFRKKWSSQWKPEEGLCNGLQTLLAATGRNRSISSKGARTLFSTCLRKVPTYISEEERWCKADDPEADVDISSEVYDYLESFSTAPQAGWKPLRQVVRAQGVGLITGAIKESLVTLPLLRQLVAICVESLAWDEAQEIIESATALIEPNQKQEKCAETAFLILKIMDEFVIASGRMGFRYEQTALMLESGKLPLDWIARHDMVDCWNKTVQSVTRGDDHSKEAARLLQLVVAMSYASTLNSAKNAHKLRLESFGLSFADDDHGSDSPAIPSSMKNGSNALPKGNLQHEENSKASTTVTCLLTVLCAVELLQSTPSTFGLACLQAPKLAILQNIAVDTRRCLEVDRLLSGTCPSLRRHRMLHPLLADALVQATTSQVKPDFARETLPFFEEMKDLGDVTVLSDSGASFLCAVAECCARASSNETFDHMQKLVKSIRNVSSRLEPRPTNEHLCNQICLASAFEYAETTKRPKHLHWALDVEQTITGAKGDSIRRSSPCKTPIRSLTQAKTGYRWEAGICEWVAKTPDVGLPHVKGHGLKREVVHRQQLKGNPAAVPRSMVAAGRSSQTNKVADSSSDPKFDKIAIPQPGRLHERRRQCSDKSASYKEEAVSKLCFSHISIEDVDDELSMPDACQVLRVKSRVLQTLSNVGIRLTHKRSVSQKEDDGRQSWGGGSQIRSKLKGSHQQGGGMPREVMDSEDELCCL
ncbi:MAG: hypothetical protein Q9190_005872 [Brigantiaea leucoxantha]